MKTEAVKKWLNALYKAGYCFSPAPAYFHWANLINPKGDKRAAEDAYRELLEEEPDNIEGLEGLTYLVQIQGRIPEAIELKKKRIDAKLKLLDLPPRELRKERTYLLASEGLGPTPQVAPESRVKRTFDKAAETFDHLLVNDLQYIGPALFQEKVSGLFSEENPAESALDLGCGTGLIGVAIRPLCKKIVGVDLSEKMLEQAELTQCYDQLHCAELLSYLDGTDQSYDLIVAGDVFVYFADLSPVIQWITNRLAPGGWLLFSSELDEEQEFILHYTTRYSHSTEHCKNAVTANGCSSPEITQHVMRYEDGKGVDSVLVVAQKN